MTQAKTLLPSGHISTIVNGCAPWEESLSKILFALSSMEMAVSQGTGRGSCVSSFPARIIWLTSSLLNSLGKTLSVALCPFLFLRDLVREGQTEYRLKALELLEELEDR